MKRKRKKNRIKIEAYKKHMVAIKWIKADISFTKLFFTLKEKEAFMFVISFYPPLASSRLPSDASTSRPSSASIHKSKLN
jgi:hypothetical protein